jgi:hypothetical protein
MKKQNEDKEVRLYLDHEFLIEWAESMDNGVPKYIHQKLEVLLDEWTAHFKKQKWPLDLEYMQTEMLKVLIGVDPIAFLVHTMKKRKVKLSYGRKEDFPVLFLNKAKPKKKPAKKGKK